MTLIRDVESFTAQLLLSDTFLEEAQHWRDLKVIVFVIDQHQDTTRHNGLENISKALGPVLGPAILGDWKPRHPFLPASEWVKRSLVFRPREHHSKTSPENKDDISR